MKIKKKTAEAVNGFGGNTYINKKLTVFNLNTSHRVGQDIFPRLTGVYSESHKKENQCFHCLKFSGWLPFGAVKTDSALRGVYVGICGGCINSLSILPPSLQKRFWQKVETNLKNTLGVKTDV